MYVLKLFLVCFLFFSFVSCKRGTNYCSTSYDKRCIKLESDAYDKGVEMGFCYKIPKDSPPMTSNEVDRLHPDLEACNAIYAEARKKCHALPYDLDSIVVTSGSTFDRGGKSVCVPD